MFFNPVTENTYAPFSEKNWASGKAKINARAITASERYTV
jgi:hypothetical protein